MYRVEWLQVALDDLTRIWLAADSTRRAKITRATNRIDAALADDPLGVSESRSGRRRIHIAAPLAVVFEIDFAQDLVKVLHVFGKRRR